ncbi:heavy-metal-associated domain-containing protein [Methanosalsum natronophilum]|nr:cation transporter [Methanosalsum natronophilum]MCS3923751.1 copper ion binding protein [Methanosalsum natronophilum]
MKKVKFDIEGMSCQHCKSAVESSLSSLNGILVAEVNLDEGTAIVEYDEKMTDSNTIKNTVIKAGYNVSEN